jgi:xylulokinase
MRNYFLGVDIGCGGAKACITGDDGALIDYGFSEHKITVSRGTWSETDPDEYWENICSIIKKMINSNNIDPGMIKAISVSSAVPAIVMIDGEGHVINKGYNFLDTRAVHIARTLKEKIGAKRCFELSGANIDEQYTVTSMLWEKANRSSDYVRIWKVLTPDAYVTFKLTGKTIVNYSAGNFYGTIFDVYNKKFDEKICSELDIDMSLLPRVHPCEEIIGEVQPLAAEITGLAKGTPVIAGTVDAFAGWLAGGAIDEGDTQLNLGTAAVLGIVTGKPKFVEQLYNCVYPVHSADNYVIFGSTTTGGYVMRHLRNNFSRYEKFVEASGGYDAYDLLNLDAESTPPGSELMITLPHFMGARAPEFNSDACGLVFGWNMNHKKGHLIRSMMEGVAMSTYTQYLSMQKGGIVTKGPIVMNEGGAKSRLWRNIFTNVFNRPTVMLKNRAGAPYGNAILAGVATGFLRDFGIAKEWAEYVDYMEPEPSFNEMYMEIFNLYSSIYDHMREDYKSLTKLRDKYLAGRISKV